MPSPRAVVGLGAYCAALPIGSWAFARWLFWIPYQHYANGPGAPFAATIVSCALFAVAWNSLGPGGRKAMKAASAFAAVGVLAGAAWLSTQDVC